MTLAEGTGGVYIHSVDATDLQMMMTSAVTLSSSRNLISERYMVKLDWLYAVLRILFLSVMGIIWSVMKLFAYCGRDTSGILPLSLLLCVLGAVLTEVLFALQINAGFVQLILCILWSLVPGQFESIKAAESTPPVQSQELPPPPMPDLPSISGGGVGFPINNHHAGNIQGLETKTQQNPFGKQLSDSDSKPSTQKHTLRKK